MKKCFGNFSHTIAHDHCGGIDCDDLASCLNATEQAKNSVIIVEELEVNVLPITAKEVNGIVFISNEK